MPNDLFRAVRDGFDALRVKSSPRPRYWIDERKCASCFECSKGFGVLTRKHHCRVCGRVFCHACSSHTLPPRGDANGKLERACNVCYGSHVNASSLSSSNLGSASKTNSSKKLKAQHGTPGTAVLNPRGSARGYSRASLSPVGNASATLNTSRVSKPRVEHSEGIDQTETDESEYDSLESESDSEVEDENTLGESNTHVEGVMGLYTSDARQRAAGQPGGDGMEEQNTSASSLFTSAFARKRGSKRALHAAAVATLENESLWQIPGTRDDGTGRDLKSVNAELGKNTDTHGGTLRTILTNVASNALSNSLENEKGEGDDNGFVATWTPLVTVLGEHCGRAIHPAKAAASYVKNLKNNSNDGMDGADADVDEYDSYEMNPDSFLAVNLVSSGDPTQSSFSKNAWSFSKNVCDRRMARSVGKVDVVAVREMLKGNVPIHDPGSDEKSKTVVKVSLLGGALEYARESSTEHAPRLSSLDTLFDQEHEHLRAASAKVLTNSSLTKPDVTLVEKSAASFARDLFYEKKTSLAIGCGKETLGHLGFMFGKSNEGREGSPRNTQITDGRVVCGECDGWRVETFAETIFDDETGTHATGLSENKTVSKKKKSVMTFYGLPVDGSGSVVTLRGGSNSELRSVERALRAFTNCSHHLDRVAAWLVTAAVGAINETNTNVPQSALSPFLAMASSLCVDSKTVHITSRSFCPWRPSAHGCDPAFGQFGNNASYAQLVTAYGEEDVPLGKALHQATACEKNATECSVGRCGEHPNKHVRVFYLKGGRVTLRVKIGDSKVQGSKETHRWMHWSRCRRCSETKNASTNNTLGVLQTPAETNSAVVVPENVLEMSFVRFLELGVSIGVSRETYHKSTQETGVTSCGHALFEERVHYFSSTRGTVCFTFDKFEPLQLAIPPGRVDLSDNVSDNSNSHTRDGAHERNTRNAQYDPRVTSVSAALGSDAYTRETLATSRVTPHVTLDGITTYFASQFQRVRELCLNRGESTKGTEDIEALFQNSLTQCTPWDTSGGKSKSFFAKSENDLFVVKQVSKVELNALTSTFAEAYFDYVEGLCDEQCVLDVKPNIQGVNPKGTLLAKLLGAFTVASDDDTSDLDFVIIENVFHGRNVSDSSWQTYDLKGSSRGRYVEEDLKKDGTNVLLDGNLLERGVVDPLVVRSEDLSQLDFTLKRDTQFLSHLNVMDYSLLVGVDATKNELVVGIIDYLRTYTWDKALESGVKSTVPTLTALTSGEEEGMGTPTVLSPERYAKRFRKSITRRYFVDAPG